MNYAVVKTPKTVARVMAEHLKQLRKSAGYTQKEAAERAGISHGSLKRFEQEGKISLQSLLRLAHLYGQLEAFEQLFDYSDEDIQRVKDLFEKSR